MEFFEIWRGVSCMGVACAAASSATRSPSFKLAMAQWAAMASTPPSEAKAGIAAALAEQMACERGFSKIMGCAALAGVAGLALGWSHSGVLFSAETPSVAEIFFGSMGIIGCVGPLAKVLNSAENLEASAGKRSKLSRKRDVALIAALEKAEISISSAQAKPAAGGASARGKTRRL